MAWQAAGCATVTEPSEKESNTITYFAGAGTLTAKIYTRTVTTTKTEVRGLTLAGANTIVTAQEDNSPSTTAIGGGGWNVRYTVTTATDWTLV